MASLYPGGGYFGQYAPEIGVFIPPPPIAVDVLVLSGFALEQPLTFASDALSPALTCVDDGFRRPVVFDNDAFTF
jgi:hypothetical protein